MHLRTHVVLSVASRRQTGTAPNAAVLTARYKLVNGQELYDLRSDPGEAHELGKVHADIVATLRSQYEKWYDEVTSERRFEMPRIHLGTRFENPVLPTRQDWRGPRATWEASGLGYWDVEVRAGGDYEVTLLFTEATEAGEAWASLGGVKATTRIERGASRVRLQLANVGSGRSRVEAAILTSGAPLGAHYVEVRRLVNSGK